MTDFLKSIDNWFLVLAVTVLGGYFLWSIQNLFADLKQSIEELKSTIKELFMLRNDHESRIKALEVQVKLCGHCNSHAHAHIREDDL